MLYIFYSHSLVSCWYTIYMHAIDCNKIRIRFEELIKIIIIVRNDPNDRHLKYLALVWCLIAVTRCIFHVPTINVIAHLCILIMRIDITANRLTVVGQKLKITGRWQNIKVNRLSVANRDCCFIRFTNWLNNYTGNYDHRLISECGPMYVSRQLYRHFGGLVWQILLRNNVRVCVWS